MPLLQAALAAWPSGSPAKRSRAILWRGRLSSLPGRARLRSPLPGPAAPALDSQDIRHRRCTFSLKLSSGSWHRSFGKATRSRSWAEAPSASLNGAQQGVVPPTTSAVPSLRVNFLCCAVWMCRFGVANTQLRLEDGSPYYIPNSELAKCAPSSCGACPCSLRLSLRRPRERRSALSPRRSAIRNLSRLSHRRILASFRLPYDDLPKVRALTARMEEYLRSRTDVDDTDRLPTRVVLGEVDDYSLVLSVQAFLPAPGVRLVEFERAKSEILQDLGALRPARGLSITTAQSREHAGNSMFVRAHREYHRWGRHSARVSDTPAVVANSSGAASSGNGRCWRAGSVG